jgi:hypothetical protein
MTNRSFLLSCLRFTSLFDLHAFPHDTPGLSLGSFPHLLHGFSTRLRYKELRVCVGREVLMAVFSTKPLFLEGVRCPSTHKERRYPIGVPKALERHNIDTHKGYSYPPH